MNGVLDHSVTGVLAIDLAFLSIFRSNSTYVIWYAEVETSGRTVSLTRQKETWTDFAKGNAASGCWTTDCLSV